MSILWRFESSLLFSKCLCMLIGSRSFLQKEVVVGSSPTRGTIRLRSPICAETNALEALCCGFESHRSYHNYSISQYAIFTCPYIPICAEKSVLNTVQYGFKSRWGHKYSMRRFLTKSLIYAQTFNLFECK